VRRRLAVWSTFYRWLGLPGPFSSPNLRGALRLAARAARPQERRRAHPRHPRAADRCLLGRPARRQTRRRPLLLAFASGGHCRSEIAGLRIEDLVERPPVPADPDAPQGPKLPVLALWLGRTKTASREDDERVLAVGRPVEALGAWLEASGISSGSVDPGDRPLGAIGDSALDGQSVNAIVKRRSSLAGLDSGEFSVHGLRCGYLTEAARCGVPRRRPCASRATARCSRPPPITTRSKSSRATRRGWRDLLVSPLSLPGRRVALADGR